MHYHILRDHEEIRNIRCNDRQRGDCRIVAFYGMQLEISEKIICTVDSNCVFESTAISFIEL